MPPRSTASGRGSTMESGVNASRPATATQASAVYGRNRPHAGAGVEQQRRAAAGAVRRPTKCVVREVPLLHAANDQITDLNHNFSNQVLRLPS